MPQIHTRLTSLIQSSSLASLFLKRLFQSKPIQTSTTNIDLLPPSYTPANTARPNNLNISSNSKLLNDSAIRLTPTSLLLITISLSSLSHNSTGAISLTTTSHHLNINSSSSHSHSTNSLA
ncbi:hypothetical protein PGT21_006841 [Puccinia graminis f. sp. tritici]|uniref:Uncharacterized protein n=1 Tax=Puccinia graminis f. sp. tritici TaxID=56615 RepID=A0A5B0N172_PUCGR|nr:hypothetical protein PGT21_006841 [Puccinia graminis f. sp. tritici]